MQRDTDFTICDLLPSIGSLASSLLPQAVPRDTFSNLRFLEILRPETGHGQNPSFTCELTERGSHPGETNYVVVSYCWQSSSSNTDTNSDTKRPLPTVQVRQHGQVRNPRCPVDILIRAIAFAVSEGVSLIWIDQECVDQTDPTDIQNHLQCNHIIFSQANFKIGLLGFELTNQRQLDVLEGIRLAIHILEISQSNIIRRWGIEATIAELKYLTRVLRAISRDRWFTRAWVIQERFSANKDMTILLPVSFRPSSGPNLIGNDFAISLGDICAIGVTWTAHLRDQGLAQQVQEHATITSDNVRECLSSLHDAAQVISGPIFSGASIDTILPSGTFDLRPSQEEIARVRNSTVHQAFLDIERCDCSVFSDRVAILSNMMRFPWRVSTTSFGSYSLALLSLVAGNERFPSVLVRTNDSTPAWQFSRPVSAMDLIVHACNLSELIARGRASQDELINVSRTLEDVFGGDITESLIRDHRIDGHEDPPEYLSNMVMEHIRSVKLVPLSATIGEILGRIVTVDHVDNVGLDHHHGETVTNHGIRTNQISEGATFIAFDGAYRWRSVCIDQIFVE